MLLSRRYVIRFLFSGRSCSAKEKAIFMRPSRSGSSGSGKAHVGIIRRNHHGSENGVRPFFVSFPVSLPSMGRRSDHVVVDEVVVAHYRR